MRCIRSQADSLMGGLPKQEMMAMALGLAHSLSRYKLKFSPDKIDTMIVQVMSFFFFLHLPYAHFISNCIIIHTGCFSIG